MPLVMFDVYTAQPLGLNGDDAEALAVILDQRTEAELAGRVRYGLLKNALVQLAPGERQRVVDALEELQPRAANPEQVTALARNLRLRIAGKDILPPPVE